MSARSGSRRLAVLVLATMIAALLAPAGIAALLAPAPPAAEEGTLDAAVVRSLRERLASGSVREAMAALAQMKEAPHSRHGLLLYEAMVRAELRIEGFDQKLPELRAERDQVAAELAAERRSTSTSVVRRLQERLAALDGELGELAARRQVESRLREVCVEAWREIAPRLAPEAAGELGDHLLAKLSEERRPGSRVLLVEMLGAVPSPRAMPPLMELAGERNGPIELALAALVALGRRGDPSATPAAVTGLAHPDWRVQCESVETLRRLHRRSSVPFLIDALERAQGRLRDDLGFALRSLTGERFVADPAIWRAWWEAHQGDFTMPEAPAEKPAAPAEGEGGTRFFGIGSFSKRVIFVLDVSTSMNEQMAGTDTRRTKLEVAKTHLKGAIAGLASDARFDVVVYADRTETLFPRVEPADDAHRAAAMEFVTSLRARSGTNIHGALLEAFRLADLEAGAKDRGARTGAAASRLPPDVDTIFFLTDGFPTTGLVRAPGQILLEIAGLNRTRRIRIHTIGIGNHDRAFLQALADQSGGTYAAH